jgi:8-oxo-dGTP diphosphatase
MMTSPTTKHPGPTEIAVAVVEHAGRYLIGLRPAGAALAGYWEFPGGNIRAGELPAEAATRECREETNLAVRVIGSYATIEHDYPHGRLRLHFFACVLADESVGPEEAPERFRWVTAAELNGYRFPPANDAILRVLCREK